MRVIGVDPGVTTGVAVWDTVTQRVLAAFAVETAEHVAVAIDVLCLDGGERPVVVVEGFPGGGHRTREAVATIKVLGFVEYYARHVGLVCVVHQPQRRLHKLDVAIAMIGQVRHANDALAHALAYATLGEGATIP